MKKRALKLEIFITPAAIIFSITGLLLSLSVVELASENMVLTTYYPAPSGIYSRMITTSQTVLARDAGLVGVGTTTPLAKLDVAGTFRVLGSPATHPQPGHVLTSTDNQGNTAWLPASGDSHFGGTYMESGDYPCRYPNPWTGACSCPVGYAATRTWDSVGFGYGGWAYQYICYKP